MKRIAPLLALLLAAGCSSPAPPPAAPVQTPATGATTEPTDWNDRAFTAIKAQRWPEAMEAAQKAVAADPKSSAAHFNLGRAFLGAGRPAEAAAALATASHLTGGANADVEYFRGQALAASGQAQEARQIWTAALAGPLKGDREIAAALAELEASQDKAIAVTEVSADVTGDGKAELLRIGKDDRFTVTDPTGKQVFAAPLPVRGLKEIPYRITVYPLPDGPPLIHVTVPTCPSAPINVFFWHNGQAITLIGDGKGPCVAFSALGGGLFAEGMRAGDLYLIHRMRFQGGAFHPAGGGARLISQVGQGRLGPILGQISGYTLENPETLFASLVVYNEFRRRTAGGNWVFQQGGEVTPTSIQVKPVLGGQTMGIATVHFEPIGPDAVRITRIDWP